MQRRTQSVIAIIGLIGIFVVMTLLFLQKRSANIPPVTQVPSSTSSSLVSSSISSKSKMSSSRISVVPPVIRSSSSKVASLSSSASSIYTCAGWHTVRKGWQGTIKDLCGVCDVSRGKQCRGEIVAIPYCYRGAVQDPPEGKYENYRVKNCDDFEGYLDAVVWEAIECMPPSTVPNEEVC